MSSQQDEMDTHSPCSSSDIQQITLWQEEAIQEAILSSPAFEEYVMDLAREYLGQNSMPKRAKKYSEMNFPEYMRAIREDEVSTRLGQKVSTSPDQNRNSNDLRYSDNVPEVLDEYYKGGQTKVQSPLGGFQSKIIGRYDLIDSVALERLAQVMEEGSNSYPKDNWKKISRNEHLNHALAHIYNYLKYEHSEQKPGEDHLGHAFARLMMAIVTQ